MATAANLERIARAARSDREALATADNLERIARHRLSLAAEGPPTVSAKEPAIIAADDCLALARTEASRFDREAMATADNLERIARHRLSLAAERPLTSSAEEWLQAPTEGPWQPLVAGAHCPTPLVAGSDDCLARARIEEAVEATADDCVHFTVQAMRDCPRCQAELLKPECPARCGRTCQWGGGPSEASRQCFSVAFWHCACERWACAEHLQRCAVCGEWPHYPERQPRELNFCVNRPS